ncbi:MAG: hypothetical protein IPM81_18435 [Saprospirales bacterium]|jgi:hypothetical protein|nr:hypothetical protein [Saprospirales bacterium]
MNRRVNNTFVQGVKFNFVMLCLEALQRGYDKMVSDRKYDVNWKEDKITAHLVEKIKQTGFLRSNQISVNHQVPIYDAGVTEGEDDPLGAPRVDFKFTQWKQEEMDFYAEAKNLSHDDWEKTDGSKVSASKYRGRYIDTGIENLVSGRYPEGCLVGYIVQGNETQVISAINRLIQTRNLLPRIGLIQKDEAASFAICYFSSHTLDDRQFIIRHLFMQF